MACGGVLPAAAAAQTGAKTIVVVPTIGSDHQFNLDYSVAHVAALLDVIAPDAIVLDDATSWLAGGCLLNPSLPEAQVSLAHAAERRIPIFGMRDWPPPLMDDVFGATLGASNAENQRLADTAAAHASWRAQMDRRSAQVARDYRYAIDPPTLERLIASGFAEREATMSAPQRSASRTRAAALGDSVMRLVSSTPAVKKWAVVVNWANARPLADALRGRSGIEVRAVESFLPLPAEALERRMDRLHLAWMLASNLDEFYGMWAPQSFLGERIDALLRRLERIAPADPVTEYLRARWLMQHRDFTSADSILSRLAELKPDVTFPFPINGKWIRPPWSSVRRKAQLNHAFILDYRGQREDALRLYRELLASGGELDVEARYFGYRYDDIQAAIRSYLGRPYDASPSDALRHLRGTVARPECEPAAN